MKTILIRWLLPIIIRMAIAALKRLAQKSDNEIDDKIVNEIAKNEQKLIDEIRVNLQSK